MPIPSLEQLILVGKGQSQSVDLSWLILQKITNDGHMMTSFIFGHKL